MRRALLLALAVASGCQTYDFQPVDPLAVAQTTHFKRVSPNRRKPNLMLAVDRSGSMGEPISGNDAACKLPDGRTCGFATAPCAAGCRTRISELRAAMGSFLQQRATVARFGLALFPDPAAADFQCGAGVVVEPVAEDAARVNARIQAEVPGGGTPTAATLRMLAASPMLQDPLREDLVLLLTDGLPNCNAANPVDPSQCLCTSCGCVTNTCSARACLDEDATVAAVKALRAVEVKTVVVGFGADLTTGPARAVLQALATEGGFASSFFLATDGAELGAALEKISKDFDQRPCEVELGMVPRDARMVAVLVDGVSVAPGPDSWQLDGAKVVFGGQTELCRRLSSATEDAPIDVEVRLLESL